MQQNALESLLVKLQLPPFNVTSSGSIVSKPFLHCGPL